MFPNSVAACTYMAQMSGNIVIRARAVELDPGAQSTPAYQQRQPQQHLQVQPSTQPHSPDDHVEGQQTIVPKPTPNGHYTTNIKGKPPPPRLPGGGFWEIRKHRGPLTCSLIALGCVLGGVCGLIPLCVPCDERWGMYYVQYILFYI
jgi:hypothetical protein